MSFYDDSKTIGRFPPRRQQLPAAANIDTGAYRVLFTRGEDVMTPVEYRRSFGQSFEQAMLGGSYGMDDELLARSFQMSSTAYACTEFCATTASTVPMRVIDDRHQPLDGTPLTYFINTLAARLIADTVRSALIWGRFYLRKRYNKGGWPTGIEWINPLCVRELLGTDRDVIGYEIRNPVNFQIEQIPAKQMIYQQVFDPHPGLNGLSKFEVAARQIGVEMGVATYAATFFINGSHPDGFLSFDIPLTDEQFNDARDEWRANFKGAKNAHKTAVMPGGARWTPITAVPKDLAMVELKASEHKEICAIFQVDPILVGLEGVADPLSANSTYSSAEVAHVRRVTLPLFNTIILPALNEQWSQTDFDNPYLLEVDEQRVPTLTDANLVRSSTAISLASGRILDYDESREIVGREPRTDYIKRDPTDALAIFRDTAISLGQFRQMMGLDQSPLDDMWNVPGLGLVPGSELRTLWQKRMLGAPSVFNTPPITGEPLPQPVIAAQGSDEPAPLSKPPLRAFESGFAFLGKFSSVSEICPIQDVLKGLLPNADFMLPNDFHVTPLISEDATAEAAAEIVRLYETKGLLPVIVGEVAQFETPDGYAIHLVIRRQQTLVDLQRDLVDHITAQGFSVSDYSQPDAYKPHITLAYSKTPIPQFPITPFALVLDAIDIHDERGSQVNRIRLRSAGGTQPALRRAAMPLVLGVSFASHQFVKQARVVLAEALTSLGILGGDWVDEADYRLPMVVADEWNPSAAADFIRRVDFEDTRKFDLTTAGYTLSGDGIYLRLNGLPSGLNKSLVLDLEAAGLTPDFVPDEAMIRLVRVERSADVEALVANEAWPALDALPLVANNLTLWLGDQPYHEWPLRGVSPARSRELAAWKRAVGKHGAAYAFRAESLHGSKVARLIRDGLAVALLLDDEAERSDMVAMLFDAAAFMLDDQKAVRAGYSDTRLEFYETLLGLFRDAQQSEISRQKLAGQMRSALRVYGLRAYRDGMNEVGHDPESFSADELNVFRDWQARQSEFVSKFGAEVFGQGISENEVDLRANMWADVSLYEIYLRGKAMGAPKKRYIWRYDPLAEHCDDCATLNGQVHTLPEWLEAGHIPGQQGQRCKQGCKCGLHETEEPARGNYLL